MNDNKRLSNQMQDLWNYNMEQYQLKNKVRDLKQACKALKIRILGDLMEEIMEGKTPTRSLVYEYAVEKNSGFDVDMEDEYNVYHWAQRYAYDIYRINLDKVRYEKVLNYMYNRAEKQLEPFFKQIEEGDEEK